MGGRSKALLAIDDRDVFVTRIVRTFHDAGVSDIVVVVGHDAEEVERVVRAAAPVARIVRNAQYKRGQFSSVLAGLDAVDRPDVDAMLLALVDAPLFAADTVRAVVERFANSGAPVVRAVRGDEHGHPVLIARRLFEAIRNADPSQGAKPIVRANASALGDVAVDDPGAFVDVDTPEDYQRLRDSQGPHGPG